MPSVPFLLPRTHGGMARAGGLVYLDGPYVVFEIQTTAVRWFKARPRTVRVPLHDVDEIRHHTRRLGRDRVVVRGRKLDALAGLPGQKRGEVRLLVERRHREALDGLLSALEARDEQ